MNVRSVGVFSETPEVVGFSEAAARAFRLHKKPMNLCGCDREESEYGVGAVVNPTKLVETLQFVGLVEGSAKAFRLRKKPMNLAHRMLVSFSRW